MVIINNAEINTKIKKKNYAIILYITKNILPEFCYNYYFLGSCYGKFETLTMSSFLFRGYNKGHQCKCLENEAENSQTS